MAEVKERQKAKSKGFAVLGVPVGAVLTLRKDPTITATVMDEKNKVEYNGKVYPISGLAKELMGTPISGYHAFKYKDVLLAKLGNSSTKPVQTPATATATKPSVTPLPSEPRAPVTQPTANDGYGTDDSLMTKSMDDLAASN